jgi:hypothetical protein
MNDEQQVIREWRIEVEHRRAEAVLQIGEPARVQVAVPDVPGQLDETVIVIGAVDDARRSVADQGIDGQEGQRGQRQEETEAASGKSRIRNCRAH